MGGRLRNRCGTEPTGSPGAAGCGPADDRHFDQCGENVGRQHIDSKDARNAGLPLDPSLAITDPRIVDYSVEAAEFVDLVGNYSCPSDGGKVARDYLLGAGGRREGVAT